MNAGSRVLTPHGPGVLVRLVIDQRWAFNRPDVITWAAVKLDGKDYAQMFHPAHVKEAPMVPFTTDEVALDPKTTTEEPDPKPDPEPEPTEPEPEGEEEVLVEVTTFGDTEPRYMPGDNRKDDPDIEFPE